MGFKFNADKLKAPSGGGGDPSQNLLAGYILGQKKAGGQISASTQNVPGQLPGGVDPDDFRQEPKVREVGGVLVQNPEWVRKPDPDKSEADVIMNIDQTVNQLDELDRKMKSGVYATGPFQYRWTQFPGAGRYMKTVGTPEEQAFRQENDRLLQSYLLAQSGVQRGFKEIGWLSSAIVNTEQIPSAYSESAKTMRSELLRNRENAVNALRQRGKAISGIREFSAVQQQNDPNALESELRKLYFEGE